jgi:superfamily II DNA helicase RecQ
MSSETLAALQMHHSRSVALLHYGRQPGHFVNLAPTQQDAMALFSLYFHQFFHMAPDAFPEFYQIFMGRESPSQSTYQPTQPTTSTALLYGKGLDQEPAVQLHHLQQYLQVQLPDSWPPISAASSKMPPNPLLNILREFLGDPMAYFRTPEQQVALYHLLKGTPNLTIILPTAGGKSMLFLLAASLRWAKTTLIMVPLVSLKDGLAAMAQNFGLPCRIWEMDHKNTAPAPLVLASIESIGNHEFLGWVQQQVANQQLDRMIFDEAHLIVDSQTFRPSMNEVHQLCLIRTPKIYMSATLPMHLYQQLISKLSIPRHLIIQANNNRPNIYYSVQDLKPPASNHFAKLMQFYHDFQPLQPPRPRFASGTEPVPPPSYDQLHEPVKAIFYFRSIDVLEIFANQYHGLVAQYYSHLKGKEEQLESFVQGQKSILAATSAVSAGYDFSGVNLVIHYGAPWGLTDWVQQSGRLSRQPDQTGHSIIFRFSRSQEPKNPEEHLIQQFMDLDGCRRGLLNSIYNNQVDQFCQPSDRPCDFCHGRNLVLARTSDLVVQGSRSAHQREVKLHQFLEFFQRECIVCSVLYYQLPADQRHQWVKAEDLVHHPGMKCHNWNHYCKESGDLQQACRSQRPPANSCHFSCFLPTRFCSQWFGSRPRHQDYGKCPKTNPILIWFSFLQATNCWDLIPSPYRPSASLSQLTNKAILDWNYQVNYDFFRTECLQGVLAFYHWAQEAEKERLIDLEE